MITNPAAAFVPDILPDDLLDLKADALQERPRIRVARAVHYDDPETELYKTFFGTSTAAIIGVDAKLMEPTRVTREGQQYEVRHYRNLREMMRSPSCIQRIKERHSARQLKEISKQFVELRQRVRPKGRLRESDFGLGLYPDEVQGNNPNVFPIQDTFLPGTISPSSKTISWSDMQDANRKCFEAAVRNPIGVRICLSGDTPIPLLDGTNPTLRQLAERGEQEVWVYACHNGQVVPAKTSAIELTGYRPVLEVELDNGEVIKATADHPFMLRDGSYRNAGKLVAGDRLMPLYRRNGAPKKTKVFYEQVWHPELGLWEFTHRLVARLFCRLQLDKPANSNIHTHHENDNSRDNRPENIRVLSQVDHVTETSRREKNREIKRRLPQSVNFGERMRELWADPEWRAQHTEKFKKIASTRSSQISDATRSAWADPEKRARYLAGFTKRPKNAIDPKTGRFLKKNHRVVAVRSGGTEPVYDLTVPDFNNFAVGQGVFVHNCRIIPQFVLGRGVQGTIKDPESQAAWNEYWKRNKMRIRMKRALRELLIYGEDFFRYFKTRDGLAVRLLDPSTIWDIVTDPEDIESVLWYHQQYMIINQSVVPEVQAAIPSTLVIRQIPASEIDHYKINATSSEKRGRSQLFPILGWLLRFKEFSNDRVLLNKMRAMFALDVAVTGSPTEVDNAQAQFVVPPGPGAILVHNDSVKVEFKNANTDASDAKTDAELLLRIIAIGAGVSEQFLGGAGQTNRASALIQTEPDVKNFEEWQELTEIMLTDQAERVFESEGLDTSVDAIEFTFPALAAEDRSAKLKDISLAESMDYFSKSRSATMVAREFGVTTYDYDKEQQQIRVERGAEPLISAPYQQVPKEMPELPVAPAAATESGNPKREVRNLGTRGTAKNKGGGGRGLPHQSAQLGIGAKNVGRQLPDTQATAFRTGFTHGDEKKRVKHNRTSGIPLRHALRETDKDHEFSSTQVNLPKRLANAIVAYGADIPRSELAADGVEDTPHITVKYGLHTSNPAAVRRALASEGPITVTLGKTSFFPNSESGSGDVLTVAVDSPDLERLNAKIAKATKCTDTHQEYIPHITVAYLKPGHGDVYADDGRFQGQTAMLSRLAFIAKDRQQTIIPLGQVQESTRHVWSDTARQKSLETRRAKALAKQRS